MLMYKSLFTLSYMIFVARFVKFFEPSSSNRKILPPLKYICYLTLMENFECL